MVRIEKEFVCFQGQLTCGDLGELVYRCKNVKGDYFLQGIRSQLKPHGWLDMLTGGTGVDPDILFILDGIMNGFRVVDVQASVDGYYCNNYSSCYTTGNEKKLKELLQDELSQGKLSYTKNCPKCVHAVGIVKKKDSEKIRPIIDCKRPEGTSVNNYTEGIMDTFKFLKIDTVVEVILTGKQYVSTVDLSHAYRSVLIHPENRELFGLSYEGKFMVDNFLCFGCRASPFIFNRLTDSVCRYMRDQGIDCYNYLDDIVCVSETFQKGVNDQLTLIQVLRKLGFGIAWAKVNSPAKLVTFLGVVIDTEKRELRLPEERLCKLRNELGFWKQKKKATEKQLQVLVGHLSHCARIIKGGKLYMYYLFKKLKEAQGKRRVKLDDQFHRDLSWWYMFAEHFNSVSLCNVNAEGTWIALSDEGNNVRVWGWEFDERISVWFTPEQAIFYEKNQNCVKLYLPGEIMGETPSRELAVLWVYLMENPNLVDCTLIVFCLHKGTCVILKKNHNRSEFTAMLLRHIYWWSMYHNVVIEPIWKPLS